MKREPRGTRLYLAGPMSGRPDNNVPWFNTIAGHLRAHCYIVKNPAELPQDLPYTELIIQGLQDLQGCQGVATIGGWKKSRGAVDEVNWAREHGLPVRPWWAWIWRSPAGARKR
jgi:hypothetical protein